MGVRAQYEAWPYPRIPLLASLPRSHVWQLDADYLWDRCGSGRAPERPRIWIAGCGTFQPYAFARANPHAQLLCTDLSRSSLRIARRRSLWHGQYGIEFQPVDLEQEEGWPDGPFDLIECYGVLMNLGDPGSTLRRLGERLAPGGVLRIMVYPHFSRQRIFQVQELAKLLGLHHGERQHPTLLRRVMAALPEAHPLRFTFDRYEDAANDPGLVDGFLHAGDRGFTGAQLCDLIAAAGLRPGFFFHRPWGQPREMARKLGMAEASDRFVLHYLDLWQELRTNFILCLVRGGPRAEGSHDAPLRPHPGWTLSRRRSPLDALDLARQLVTGARLPSRTEAESIRVAGSDLRAARRSERGLNGREERLRDLGLVLGGARAPALESVGTGICPEPEGASYAFGHAVPNPLYHHLFAAWQFGPQESGGVLPSLHEQVDRWAPHTDPLESARCPLGLTPWGSFAREGSGILDWLERRRQTDHTGSIEDWQLADETAKAHDVRGFLARFELPRATWSDSELRRLWLLLFSYEQLFVDSA